MDPNAFAASPQVMRSGCTFTASLTNGAIRCGWLLTGRDQLCFDQVSRVGSDWFLPPPKHTGSSHGWHSATEVNFHCDILCWNCFTGSGSSAIVPTDSVSRAGDIAVYVLDRSVLFRSCVYFCLYGPFNYISLHKSSRQFSAFSSCSFQSYFCLIGPFNYTSLYESLPSPDILFYIIQSGWLSSKH